MYNYTIYERFYQGGAGNWWEFFSVRNVAEKFAFRGSLPLVKCVTVWAL